MTTYMTLKNDFTMFNHFNVHYTSNIDSHIRSHYVVILMLLRVSLCSHYVVIAMESLRCLDGLARGKSFRSHSKVTWI